MSIDFSKVTGWSTEKGVVKQVTNSAGRVIWSAKTVEPELVTVSFTSDIALPYDDCADIYISTPDNNYINFTETLSTEVEVPTGSRLNIKVYHSSCSRSSSSIYINVNDIGVQSISSSQDIYSDSSHSLTINGPMTITLDGNIYTCSDCRNQYYSGTMYITDDTIMHFVIESTGNWISCQGLTWGEWIKTSQSKHSSRRFLTNSSNTDTRIYYDMVSMSAIEYTDYVALNGVAVSVNDPIIDGATYTIMSD